MEERNSLRRPQQGNNRGLLAGRTPLLPRRSAVAAPLFESVDPGGAAMGTALLGEDVEWRCPVALFERRRESTSKRQGGIVV